MEKIGEIKENYGKIARWEPPFRLFFARFYALTRKNRVVRGV